MNDKAKKLKKMVMMASAAVVAIGCILMGIYITDPNNGNELLNLKGTASIEATIRAAILDRNMCNTQSDFIHCESHEIFSIKDSGTMGKTITIYLTYAYEEYYVGNGDLDLVYACIVPATLTVRALHDGSYKLLRYWEPHDGVRFASDVKRKFPDIPVNVLYGIDLKARLIEECRDEASAIFTRRENN